jgi:two-component system chemotaxis sensor kinase CheA
MKNTTVTVDLEKLEKLLNKVGDMVITNSMMSQSIENLPASDEKKELLAKTILFQRHIKELQDYAMDIRMIKIKTIFDTYQHIISQECSNHGKLVHLHIKGGETNIDKSMIEALNLPLKSIITNSVIHGIETPTERTSKGKNEYGTINVSAEQINEQIYITIQDDGRGIDVESLNLESQVITEEDLEGNDLNIQKIKYIVEKLNGRLEISSTKDEGTKLIIIMPLTLSILDGLNIRIGDNIFILPTNAIIESLQPTNDMIKLVGDGSSQLLMLREEFIPIIKLYQQLDIEAEYTDFTKGILIVVKSNNQKAALFVDEFLQQQQIVVKPIEINYKKVVGISGATVKGNGSIGLILDVKSILEQAKITHKVIGEKHGTSF